MTIVSITATHCSPTRQEPGLKTVAGPPRRCASHHQNTGIYKCRLYKIRITDLNELKQRLGTVRTEPAKLDHVVIVAVICQWRRWWLQSSDARFCTHSLAIFPTCPINWIQIWRISSIGVAMGGAVGAPAPPRAVKKILFRPNLQGKCVSAPPHDTKCPQPQQESILDSFCWVA